MGIVIGSDHRGFILKEEIKLFLRDLSMEYEDLGVCSDKESVDYPDIGSSVAAKVSQGEFDRAILICATGIGMSIVANKYPRIRAALCGNIDTARLSRQHNNSNILILPGKLAKNIPLAKRIIRIWLQTEFSGGRHTLRIKKINDIEHGVFKECR